MHYANYSFLEGTSSTVAKTEFETENCLVYLYPVLVGRTAYYEG